MLRSMLVATALLSIAACAGGGTRRDPPAFDREELRQSLTVEQLVSSARIAPDREHGHLLGYRFGPVSPASLFGKIGVRDGDLLVGLNGEDWAQPDLAEALVRLHDVFVDRDGPDPRSLRVRRDGATLDLPFRIE
jgi:type II secretory pathway component PulC